MSYQKAIEMMRQTLEDAGAMSRGRGGGIEERTNFATEWAPVYPQVERAV